MRRERKLLYHVINHIIDNHNGTNHFLYVLWSCIKNHHHRFALLSALMVLSESRDNINNRQSER